MNKANIAATSTLGQIAYDAYCQTVDNNVSALWPELGEKGREAWEAAAFAAIDAVWTAARKMKNGVNEAPS